MIEHTIKSGMLGQLKDAMQAVKLSKSVTHASNPWNSVQHNYIGSDSRIDIPLREPLETEYRLNRKLAKQIYNKERKDNVVQKKQEINSKFEQDIVKYNKDKVEQEKKLQRNLEKVK